MVRFGSIVAVAVVVDFHLLFSFFQFISFSFLDLEKTGFSVICTVISIPLDQFTLPILVAHFLPHCCCCREAAATNLNCTNPLVLSVYLSIHLTICVL